MATSERNIDVIGNAEQIVIPTIREMHSVEGTFYETELRDWEWEKWKNAKLATIATTNLRPLLGELEAVPAEAVGETVIFHGKELRGAAVLGNTKAVEFIDSAAIAEGQVLVTTADPRVEGSLLVAGGSVLGDGHGTNGPAFDENALGVLLNLMEGIHSNNEAQVMQQLPAVNRFVHANDRTLYGGSREADFPYRQYGEYDTTASVFDEFFLPALQGNNRTTTNVTVSNSIVYGSDLVLANVLGGEVKDSVLASNTRCLNLPRQFSHMAIENTYLMSLDGVQLVTKNRFGNPEKARDVVAAARELPAKPLASFAR